MVPTGDHAARRREPRADVARVAAGGEIEHGEKVSGMRIIAVDAVAVDGNVRGFVIGRDGQLVDPRYESLKD